jgi:hypothetical protein
MPETFTVYNDPSHGWAKVPIILLYLLGIQKNISNCSYQRGDFAYLEEDADLTLFIKSYDTRYRVKPKFKDMYSNKSSKIRSYESYNQ